MHKLKLPKKEFLDFAKKSKNKFKDIGWPTSKLERWKFSPLNRFFDKKSFSKIKNSYLKHNDSNNFLNISPLDNKTVKLLKTPFLKQNHMTNIVLANFTDGFVANLDNQEHKKRLIKLDSFVGINEWSSSVIIFNISRGSEANLLINFELSNNSMSTPLIILNLEDHAKANLGISISNNINQKNNECNYVGLIHSNLSVKSKLEISLVQHSNMVSRNDINVDLFGEESEFILNGVYLSKDNHHNDITTSINHLNEYTKSFQNVRGILDDKSKGVFQGGIYVDKKAQKTDGQQMSKVLMLSKLAEANSKPELKIYADDVSCSHGNTIGDLNFDQLFYLLSRGLSEELSRKILIHAFLQEIEDEITNKEIKEFINNSTNNWLMNYI